MQERELSDAIEKNLQISGYFNVLPKDSYVQRQTRCANPTLVVQSDWTIIGVQYVVTASLRETGDELIGDFFLIDTSKGVVMGKNYSGPSSFKRSFAHRFSNEILRFFTGELGPFGSKIVYSTKIGRFKELAIMDMDGYDQRILTSTKGLATSASFDPTGRRAIYTDFRKGVPDVFIIDVFAKSITQITKTNDQEFSPIFLSSDEYMVAVSNQRGGSSLVIMNRSGQVIRTVIGSLGEINVSPSFDPVNRILYFVSDQTGKPQVYRMSMDGGFTQRVSNVPSNYCTSPAVSPKGDKLAFVCRFEGGFNLFVSNSDGSNPIQLTSYGRNEDPTWSPDGRYIAFASTAARGQSSISIIRFDGRAFTTISKPFGAGDSEPAWGPIIN